jgi:hypothetical protein
VLAVHVSNLHLELASVVRALAESGGESAASIDYNPSDADDARDPQSCSSDWILLVKDASFLEIPAIASAIDPWPANTEPLLWTDDYSSLLAVMRRWQKLFRSE